MYCQADGSSAIHLGRLSLKLWDPYLGSSGWIGRWYVKVEVELIALEVVHIPALPGPLGALLVAGDGEPVRV